jgi:hypothetical protein
LPIAYRHTGINIEVLFESTSMKKKSSKGIGTRGDALPPDNSRVRNQLPRQAERYLRKPANIEDLPDAEQVREAEEVINRTKRKDT